MKVVTTPEFEKDLKRMFWRQRLAPINPKTYYRYIKHFIQRGRRGYSDADLWNANDHIARIVIAFLDHTENCPMSGYPANLTEKKWNDYKAELRWLMQQELDMFETEPEVMATEAYQTRMKKASRLFGEYWQSLWD